MPAEAHATLCIPVRLPQDLELGRLATAFALLRLPRMPEIKQGGRTLAGFTPSAVDPDSGEAALVLQHVRLLVACCPRSLFAPVHW